MGCHITNLNLLGSEFLMELILAFSIWVLFLYLLELGLFQLQHL